MSSTNKKVASGGDGLDLSALTPAQLRAFGAGFAAGAAARAAAGGNGPAAGVQKPRKKAQKRPVRPRNLQVFPGSPGQGGGQGQGRRPPFPFLSPHHQAAIHLVRGLATSRCSVTTSTPLYILT
ncbi:hypothetical protein CEP53_009784, partial [Fusarium sp. AF-6]